MSAMVFKHIFVNHRAVFELGRESGEIVEDSEHEDTSSHHTSNLIEQYNTHYLYWWQITTNMKNKLLIWRLTRIYLSPTDRLSMSLMTVSDILNIGDNIIWETIKKNHELYPKLFATSNSFLLAPLSTSLWSYKHQHVSLSTHISQISNYWTN